MYKLDDGIDGQTPSIASEDSGYLEKSRLIQSEPMLKNYQMIENRLIGQNRIIGDPDELIFSGVIYFFLSYCKLLFLLHWMTGGVIKS